MKNIKKYFSLNLYFIRAAKLSIFGLGLLFVLIMISLYLKLSNNPIFISFYEGVNEVSLFLGVVIVALFVWAIIFNIIREKIKDKLDK